MNGKKFVIYFLILIAVTAVTVGIWIKQGYDSRPQIEIKEPVK